MPSERTFEEILYAKDDAEARNHAEELVTIVGALMFLRMARTRDQWDSAAPVVWAALERCSWISGKAVHVEPWPGVPGLADRDRLLEAAKACRAAETPEEFGASLATLWAAIDRCERGGRASGELIPFPGGQK